MSKTEKNVKTKVRSKQTAKQFITETKSEPVQDFISKYKQNVEKYFANMENSIPTYYQTLTELQQEFLQAWENIYNASITVQKEFLTKTGMNSEQSKAASKFVSDTTEAAIKARTIRDEVFLNSIDTTKENVKEWNNRSQEFADLNRKFMQSWVSSFTPRQN